MDFAPLTQIDIDAAAEWMRGIPLRPDRWRDDDTRSVIATESGAIVGVGIMWTSRVHGDRYWCEVAVAPDRRRAGRGRTMFEHLSRLRARDLEFMTRGYVDDERMAFARALGAHTIQIVPPSHVQVAAGSALRTHPEVRPASSADLRELYAANAATYAWTHADWSPVGAEFADALNEDLAAELDAEASSIAVVSGQIAATCLVYHDTEPPILTAETTRRDTPDGERLVEGCIRRSLDVLAERGIEAVEFDGHVSDPHLLPVWTRLEPSGRWFHLVEVPAFRPRPTTRAPR